MKNTIENKAKFFALYWKQKIGYKDGFNTWHVGGVINMAIDYLELTPLSQISDEDAIEVAKICYVEIDNSLPKEQLSTGTMSISKFKEYMQRFSFGIGQYTILVVSDYLRSRGYALPYMGLSVEKLIEYGWVKLKIE